MTEHSTGKGGFVARDRDWHPAPYHPPYKTSVKRSPQAALLSFPTTASEITGPTFGHGIIGPQDNDLIHNFTGESAIGPRIVVHGRVQDEFGRGVGGALVEVWQANAGGRYRHKKEGYLAAARPQLRRLRAGHHRRRWILRVSHDHAGAPIPGPTG